MELELTERPALNVAPQAADTLPALHPDSPTAFYLTALRHGATPADLRELMAIRQTWEADAARKAYYKALAAFKLEPVYVRKTKGVGYETKDGDWVGYKHAELADVVAAVGPALAKHGLAARWDVKQTRDWISVRCILTHADGYSESVEMGGPPDMSGKKNTIQAIASTATYLKRYTLKAITGVAEENDDDDGRGGADDMPEQGARTRGNGDGNQPPVNTRPAYPDDDFRRNLPSWHQAIAAGKKTAEEVIATVENKAQQKLTDAQKAAIRNTPKA